MVWGAREPASFNGLRQLGRRDVGRWGPYAQARTLLGKTLAASQSPLGPWLADAIAAPCNSTVHGCGQSRLCAGDQELT